MMRTVLVVGPALSRSGYGEQTRFAIRALASRPDLFDVYIKNIPWGATGWITNSHPERDFIDSKIIALGRKDESFRAEVSLQVTIPAEFKVYSTVNVGYTAGIEADRVNPEWVDSSNMMSGLILVSNHALEGFKNLRIKNSNSTDPLLEVPTAVVNYPHESGPPEQKLPLEEIETEFNFLSVAQVSPRKNIYNSIRWFVEEFRDESNIGFVLKLYNKNCSTIDRHRTVRNLKIFTESLGNYKCGLYLLHGDLTPGQMKSLYKSNKVKVFLTTAHGEGFGLPIFEAAANSLPILSPDWGGQKDFLYALRQKKVKGKRIQKNKACFVKLDYKVKPVEKAAQWKGVIDAEAQWCYVDEKSCKSSMRKVVENYNIYLSVANDLTAHIKKEFSFEKKSQEFNEAFLSFIENNNIKQTRRKDETI